MDSMIFYCATEAELFDRELSRRGLADIRDKGFESIYLEFRNTRAPRSSMRFREAERFLCEEAARLGLRVMLDANVNQFDAEWLADCPEVFTDALGREVLPVREGRFALEIGFGDASACVLEAAWFRPDASGPWEPATARCRLVAQASDGGGCAMTRQKGAATTRQEWALDGGGSGELFVVRRKRFLYANRDLGHPAVRAKLPAICDHAAALGVAGLVWDEPHFGLLFLDDEFPVGERLYAAFAARFGYDLKGRLIDLWIDVEGRDSGRVRLDFAELLESELALLAGEFKRLALAHPGLGGRNPDFFVGIHRTMHEELSDDFRIGSSDYFRHNATATAGFTDSVFEREDSVLAMSLLALSLGRAHGGKAWNNAWGFRTTEAHVAYYPRLMGCLGVRWNAHAYHNSMLFGPGYPHHPTWANLGEHLAAQRGLLAQIDGAEPEFDTAIVYNWRALADRADAEMHDHRRSLLAACLGLALAGRFPRIIAPEEIGAAAERGLDLLVLWPNRLPAAAWPMLEAAADANRTMLFAGPPARATADGAPCAEAWRRITGCAAEGEPFLLARDERVEIAGAMFAGDLSPLVPNWESNPERCYAGHLRAWETAGGDVIARALGRAFGIRNRSATTVLAELPQFPGALARLLPGASELPDRFLAFRHRRGERRLWAFCARGGEPVDAFHEWRGHRVRFENCRHGILWEESGRVGCWGEGVAFERG